jgi:hypothetical protein
MRTKRVLGSIAAGTAAVIVCASAAVAGTNSSVSTTTGGSAKFVANGDSITVCDTGNDGYNNVYAQYRINGGTIDFTASVTTGPGTCGSRSTGNPAEGSTVSIRVVRGGPNNVGPWVSGVA